MYTHTRKRTLPNTNLRTRTLCILPPTHMMGLITREDGGVGMVEGHGIHGAKVAQIVLHQKHPRWAYEGLGCIYLRQGDYLDVKLKGKN